MHATCLISLIRSTDIFKDSAIKIEDISDISTNNLNPSEFRQQHHYIYVKSLMNSEGTVLVALLPLATEIFQL